jgi:hypothetical protein
MIECKCPFCHSSKCGIYHNMWKMGIIHCDNCRIIIGLDSLRPQLLENVKSSIDQQYEIIKEDNILFVTTKKENIKIVN